MNNFPRILITAPNSGAGKTTVTCAILKALTLRKLQVASYKCGPDYIDPMFHSKITSRPSYNLDLFFSDEKLVRGLLAKHSEGADISVIEGAMGFYDGVGGVTEQASAYHVALATKTPVIMVINPRGASLSIAATLKGMADFRQENYICGVVFNNCSEKLYKMLAPMIESETGIMVLGYLPNMPKCAMESRHLGLVMANEIVEFEQKMQELARQAENTIDIDKIIDLANAAPEISGKLPIVDKIARDNPRIALARDEAFCFYYEDNLELMRELGAEIVEFSPIHDDKLPPNISALYLGGGYPELYLRQLSENKSMICDIKHAIKQGMPSLAECGGFMYLHETITDKDGQTFTMAGAHKGNCSYLGKLTRFGYITLSAKGKTAFCEENDKIMAHEFHYFDSNNCGNSLCAQKPKNNKKWDCVNCDGNLFAGFPHLYFYSNIEFVQKFVLNADTYGSDKNDI